MDSDVKIYETTVRDCCQIVDLDPVTGTRHDFRCRHCGKAWERYRYTDAAGSGDWDYRPKKGQ